MPQARNYSLNQASEEGEPFLFLVRVGNQY